MCAFVWVRESEREPEMAGQATGAQIYGVAVHFLKACSHNINFAITGRGEGGCMCVCMCVRMRHGKSLSLSYCATALY